MIVVLGSPVLARDAAASLSAPAGLAAAIAMAAAAAGSVVQVVGKVGDDPAGDEILLGLTRAGVGHAAVLRDAAQPTPAVTGDVAEAATGPDADAFSPEAPESPAVAGLGLEAADVELALRYLTEFRVLVLADRLDADARATALDAAAFSAAHVIDLHGRAGPAGTQPGEGSLQITAFEAPASEPEAFGQVVGRYAAGLDAGRPAADAFRDATRAGHWTPATD